MSGVAITSCILYQGKRLCITIPPMGMVFNKNTSTSEDLGRVPLVETSPFSDEVTFSTTFQLGHLVSMIDLFLVMIGGELDHLQRID